MNILLANVGIDYWPNKDNFTTNIDSPKIEGNIINEIENIPVKNLRSLGRINLKGRDVPSNDPIFNPYNYGCYVNNKLFNEYLQELYSYLNTLNIDIFILQEYCYRNIDKIDFADFYAQLFRFPGNLKKFVNRELTNEEKQLSRKSLLIGTKDKDIKIIPIVDDKTKLKDEKNGFVYNDKMINMNEEMFNGNIQIGLLEIKNNKILIINLHYRYKDYNIFKKYVNEILSKYNSYKNIIFAGDFNLITEIKSTIEKYGFKYCNDKYCNLNNIYNKQNHESQCGNKKWKNTNMQLYYKLKDYELSIESESCKLNQNVSSHIFLIIKLSEKKQNKKYFYRGDKRKQYVIRKGTK